MANTKTATIRQDSSQAADLEARGTHRRRPVSEAVRTAISDHINARCQDPEFQDRLRRIMDEERVVLERLAE